MFIETSSPLITGLATLVYKAKTIESKFIKVLTPSQCQQQSNSFRKMLQNNPISMDHLREATACINELSETHQNFQKPNLKKSPVTRAARYEQFLWREFYDEYIRSKQRLEAIRPATPSTEYNDEFNRPHIGEERKIASDELIEKFPLYATNAVTLWNPKGDFSCNFKRVLSVTLPVELQPGTFDERNILSQ